jgi:trehalose-phosphatase
MTDDMKQVLQRLTNAHRAGRPLALLVDYDGTLVPIVKHPAQAVLAPEVRELLRRLASLPRVIVGIVSGRALDDLRKMVGIPGLCYVGTSGLECELNGAREAHGDSQEVHELLAQATHCLAELTRQYPGAWVEQKPLALTLHYRDVSAGHLAEFLVRANSVLMRFDGDLCVTDGPMATEITPDLGWTKGTAVRWLCERFGADVIPIYAGDHANDRDALVTAAALGGVSIRVGPESPATPAHRLADPAALIDWLQRLLNALSPCE